MYEYIKGQVTFVSPYYIVIEANGIGYQVAVANPFMYRVDETVVKVYVQQVVREDSQTLYGFGLIEEKQLFIKLNSVSGIGPKSALAIMASDDHGGLVSAVESADSTFLTKFPGVGKKTAQQMILDLKGKLTDIGIEVGGRQTSLDIDSAPVSSSNNPLLDEASEALQALGYSAKEVKRVSKELAKVEATTTDEYLRHGLKLMMKK